MEKCIIFSDQIRIELDAHVILTICFSAIAVLSTHIKVSQLLLVKGEDYLTDYGQCDGNLRKKKNSE